MKIRSKLRIVAILPMLVFLALASARQYVSVNIDEGHNKEDICVSISQKTSAVVTLTYEYGITGSERTLIQWVGRHDALEAILKDARTRFTAEEEKGLLDAIDVAHQEADKMFSELHVFDSEGRRDAGSVKLRENMLNNIILRLYDSSLLTDRLYELCRRDVRRFIVYGNIITAALVLMLVILTPFLSFFIVRGITGQIDQMGRGMKAVASGDLTYRIAVSSEDEIGYLAGGFNDMTAKLREIAVSREELRKEIDERRRAEESLKESESRLKEAQAIAHIGHWDLDLLTNTLYWSDEVYRIFGLVPQEFGATYEAFVERVHPDDREFVGRKYTTSVKDRTGYDIEHRLLLKDGEVRHVNERCVTEYDQDGNPLRSIGTVQDITERKRNEEINESRMHLIQFSASHSVDELLEETINKAEKLTGSLIGFYHFVEKDQKTLTLQNWSARTKAVFCKAEGKGLHYAISEAGVWADCIYQRRPVIHNDYASLPNRKSLPEGHAEVVRELVVPVIRGDNITAILGVGNKPSDYDQQDVKVASLLADLGWEITERAMAEEALQRLTAELEKRIGERTGELRGSQGALMNIVEDLNEKTDELKAVNVRLKELDRMKSMFIASMSHELRTPLNSIIGFSSIMLDGWTGPVNEEQKNNLSIVLRSGRHLLSLINDVIDVSKIEAGKIEVSYEDFDLYDVMTEAVELFKKDLQDKGLDLKFGPVHLAMHTDRRRLLQCVVNLIGNAVKFTEKGNVRISAQRITPPPSAPPLNLRGGEGELIEISVEDTGIGIKEEDLPRLFGAFVRVHSPQVMSVKGTGLGLYLTKKIVTDILKGEITAESEYEKGSRFVMRIPVKCE